MGLGPHGGLHSPQVLHSDHEPFTAMRGGVYRVRISGLAVVREAIGIQGSHQSPKPPASSWAAHPHSTVWEARTEAALDVVAVPDILIFPSTPLSVKLAAFAAP